MSWMTEAGTERDLDLETYALPDFRLSLQLGGTHWRQVREGWSYPRHNHLLFELNIVLEGRQITTVDETEFVQTEGDLLFIQPGRVHESRNGQAAPMTYFCLHFDIEDAAVYRRMERIGNARIAADSELAIKLRPWLLQMARPPEPGADGDADAGFALRAAMLNVLLALGDYAASEEADQPALPSHPGWQSPAMQRLREQYALEKKVEDLLCASEDDGLIADKSLFPPFQWVGLFSIVIPDRGFWTKPERFMAKILLDDALSGHGIAAVVVGEQSLTAVLFSDRAAVPPMEEYAARCKALLEKNLKVAIRLGVGGAAPEAGKLRDLYRLSLRRPGMAEPPPAKRNSFEFMSRTVRLALLTIETEFGNPDLTLGLLAKKLGLTPNYVSALFRTETGQTFTWHLSRIRIERAKTLLRETNLKIFQVGRQVGLADQAYFSRLFKRTVGISPNDYRARARPGPGSSVSESIVE
ncbi:AraC family transcriptional regulator [Cohnella zeiphila]|uniref:AraC family transcriptional regulator n=1 Tax=Cohnella zeiphila TaxID=2761120 RepID=A0A7X0SLJ1_9BACL|nr:AraC family transcriptional regulator [Cohnella zeiphila]MBB6730920.1 AraC family transcriptional regulator [Cohnella zeiphila]